MQVHLLDAKELRERFDRAYAARRKAGHSIPVGRGIWIALYLEESDDPVTRVGGGIGLLHPAIERVPLNLDAQPDTDGPPALPPTAGPTGAADAFEPLTIAQAKLRLARTLGVDPGSIKITVEA